MKPSADNHPNKEYLKTKVMTASPEQLQLMLYDGAIRFCEQARTAIENKEIEKSYTLILRAENIVMELCNGMKNDVAPDICANMKRLYLFCYERLVEANMKRVLPPLDEALQVLRHMRETWMLLMEKLHQEKSQQAVEIPSAIPIPSPSGDQREPAELRLGAVINFQG
jgi:flagellar secretion chaperone FliS